MNSAIASAEPFKFDFTDPQVMECPYPLYEQLRGHAPAHFVEGAGFWIISRYDDCLAAIRNPKVFSSKMGFRPGAVPDEVMRIYTEEGFGDLPDTLVSNDPPSHTRYRKLVDRTFTAGRVRQMEEYMVEVVRELIDNFIEDGRLKVMHDFAIPVPMFVIADQLGVPRSHRDKFKEWSDAAVAPLGLLISTERKIECAKLAVEMQHYFVEVFADRRKSPRDDIISDLVTKDVDGAPLDTPELLSILNQLLVAGNETTTSAIGASVIRLAQEPELVERLVREPGKCDNFAEEILRHESPVQGLFRMTMEDVQIGGTTIPKGSLVNLRYGSANRDERRFECPADFDVDRKNSSSHLAFGAGIHHCIGAQLARREIAIAVREMTARLKDIRLVDPDKLSHTPSVILRGLNEFEIEFSKR
ncbi:cytochrome P450 [Sphingomonas sp. ID1715]|uniref:cytochrome P450 n=1 Tax=Sphingomonas sp. ID1715 TaxID=1656898 RepID=UPI0014887744|nr:cytochrome P450 [Sphingomonas sp. ID1715]NNM78075.1 cytochrome P450 [Sphingomonas sp. ID1715]